MDYEFYLFSSTFLTYCLSFLHPPSSIFSIYFHPFLSNFILFHPKSMLPTHNLPLSICCSLLTTHILAMLFLSTYYFFPICCTIPNDLKFFKHVANLTWNVNPKKHQQHGHFFIQIWAYKVQLPDFLQGQKRILANSNANILQSIWWKFLKFFPHFFKLVYYKILWLHISKNIFFLNFSTYTRNGSLGVFLVRTQSRNFRG